MVQRPASRVQMGEHGDDRTLAAPGDERITQAFQADVRQLAGELVFQPVGRWPFIAGGGIEFQQLPEDVKRVIKRSHSRLLYPIVDEFVKRSASWPRAIARTGQAGEGRQGAYQAWSRETNPQPMENA